MNKAAIMNLKTQTFNSSRLELWLPGSIVQVSNTQATQWVREYIYLRLQCLQNSVSVSAGTSLYYSRTVNKFHRNSPSWVFLSIPAVQKATIGSASAHTAITHPHWDISEAAQAPPPWKSAVMPFSCPTLV